MHDPIRSKYRRRWRKARFAYEAALNAYVWAADDLERGNRLRALQLAREAFIGMDELERHMRLARNER